MKEKSISSAKNALILLLSFVHLSGLTSCNNSAGNIRQGTNPSAPEISVKQPGMDIHTATFMGNIEALKQHIAAGTDLNKKDNYGSSPLIIAATFGKTNAAKVLLEAGAEVNLTNNDGSTPLHVAAYFCRTEIVEELLEHGADKSLKNKSGITAYESVASPFEDNKEYYDFFSRELGPLGLKFDYDYLKKTRPVIAQMLK